MQIDWFTVVAQIANFLILLYLLRRFFYKPVVRMMDERQEQIAARFKEAKEEREAAEAEGEQLRQTRKSLQSQRERLMGEARREAERRKEQMLAEAQQDVAERQKNWQNSLKKEHEDFLRELRQDLGEQAILITRRALLDLADEELEQKVIDHFFKQLADLKEPQKKELAQAVENMDGRVIVRSAFVLPGEQRSQFVKLLQTQTGRDKPVPVHFDRSTDLISGIEIYASGQKLGWSFDLYLDQLEERIRQIIEEKIRREEEQDEAEIGKEDSGKN